MAQQLSSLGMNEFKERLSILRTIESMWDVEKKVVVMELDDTNEGIPICKLKLCFKMYVLVQDSNETVQLSSDCDVNDDDNDDLECDESTLDVLLETMRAMDDGKVGTQFFHPGYL